MAGCTPFIPAAIRPLLPALRKHHAATIYMALVSRANSDGEAWPSLETIAADAGVKVDTAVQAIKLLGHLGLIERTKSKGNCRVTRVLDSTKWSYRTPAARDIPPDGISRETGEEYPRPAGEQYPRAAGDKGIPRRQTKEGTPTAPAAQAYAASAAGDCSSASDEDATGTPPANDTTEGLPPADTSSRPKDNHTKPKASSRRHAQPSELPPGVLTDPLVLTAFIIHGAEAVGKPMGEWASLPAGPNHWAPAGRNLDQPEATATIPQLAWFYWCRAMIARHRAGQEISMPAFGRLVGAVKALVQQRGRDRAIKIIDTITGRWGDIRQRLSWMTDLAINEATLSNTRVIEAALAVERGETLPAQAGKPGVGENTNEDWKL